MLGKDDIPQSWSSLTWRQLCDAWTAKMRYGGNGDVAQAAAFLALCGMTPVGRDGYSESTGEAIYTLRDKDGGLWKTTPRELSQMATQAIRWFGFPYGDPGKDAVRDEKGRVVEEAVEPVRGYVNPGWRDAMQLPEETVVVAGDRMMAGSEWQAMSRKERHNPLHFKLPEVTLRNVTWAQYRTLQFITPELFREGVSEEDIVSLQAEFLAHILVPGRQKAAAGDPFATRHNFEYDSERAEQTVAFWHRLLTAGHPSLAIGARGNNGQRQTFNAQCLYCLCFQMYQTAMRYYGQVFPLLFNDGGKSDPLQDALTGETKTLNAIMKYQGYIKPEDVYAENLPVIFSTLSTMAEEAKQIEKMNAKIKSKR